MSAAMEPGHEPLLRVRGLRKAYPVRRGWMMRVVDHVAAVDGVDLDVAAGETVGLVGESGSGKTTVGRCVLRLVEPDAGTVSFDGQPVLTLGAGELRRLRRQMQPVFQDPFASLNPRMTVGQMLTEPLVAHRIARGGEARDRAAEILDKVELGVGDLDRYPHEFSGGQRQRIAIARALVLGPRFLVCDEPVSALDVSIQAQILNLLVDLQQRDGLAYLFISHDLAVVRHVSHRVAVMYRGRIVEQGPAAAVFADPQHPYTQLLKSSVPTGETGGTPRDPAPAATTRVPGTGCTFRARCPLAMTRCGEDPAPPLERVAPNHRAACWVARGPDGR